MSESVGTAFLTLVPKVEKGWESKVGNETSKSGKSIGDKLGSLIGKGAGGKMTDGIKAALAGSGGAAIVGAFAAVAASCIVEIAKIGEEFDRMVDTIVVGTGASGDALNDLKNSAMSIGSDVPVSFDTAGDIIQDFATRLDLSGESLEKVSEHAAELNYVIGGFNYDQMATMFNVWQVGADDMSGSMDYLFGVAQSTGIGFDKLTSVMQSNGGALQSLGFSFEEAANLAGLLDKHTGDATGAMSSLSRAMVNLAEPGEELSDTFRRSMEELEGLVKAGDEAAAIDLASEMFGKRGAAGFVNALQSGKISMEQLADAALGAGGDISATSDAIESWPQIWGEIKNGVKAAFEPLASGVFKAIGGVLGGIKAAMDALWSASEPLRTAISELATEVGSALQPVFTAIYPVLQAVGNVVYTVLSVAFKTLGAIVQGVAGVFRAFVGAISPIVSAVGDLFSSLVERTRANWEAIKEAIYRPIQRVWELIKPIIDKISSALSGIGSALGGFNGGQGLDFGMHASGGIATTAHFIGEAGPEAIMPLRGHYMMPFAQAVADNMGGHGDIYIDGAIVNQDEAIESAFVGFMSEIARVKKMGVA